MIGRVAIPMGSAAFIRSLMKSGLCVLLLLFSLRTLAQLDPPDLRCLSVINAAGDLKITWIPPTDPGNTFYGYEISVSNAANGIYSIVSATAGPRSTASYVHTGTVTLVQPLHVYVRSLSGPGGSIKSRPSDTLASIFLNINTSISETYRLNWNEMHTPRLSSAGATMSIAREYPPGVWTPVANTSLLQYNDTLAICNTANLSMSYSIGLADNSGCLNSSNWQVGKYKDKHQPYLVYLDSISVLPNGQVAIAWPLPHDKDVVQYQIQQDILGLNTGIAMVPGYTSTSFVLSSTAATAGTVALFVAAIDSCGSGGEVDYEPVSIFLKARYDHCAFTTNLEWTAYRWAKRKGLPLDEVLEYRVYFSEDSGATWSRLASTTNLNYTHQQVPSDKQILYFVRVVNKRQTMTASSNRKGFYSGRVPAPDFVYIKNAGITKKNTIELQVYVDNKKSFRRLMIYRSQDGVNFDTIGSVTYSAISNYVFTDEKASTDHQAYYYHAWLVDSCGNVRIKSNTVRTILLRVQEDQDHVFQRHLSWNAYEGFDQGVKQYEIYRYVNDIRSAELIGRFAQSLNFTDNLEGAATQGARIEYLVKAIEEFGNQYGIQEYSNSNFAAAYMEGRLFIPNAFAPDGENRTWKPIVQYIENREYNVSVFNRFGQLVFETTNSRDSWNGENCPNDVYAYIVSFRNSRGEYQQVTGSVLLIR